MKKIISAVFAMSLSFGSVNGASFGGVDVIESLLPEQNSGPAAGVFYKERIAKYPGEEEVVVSGESLPHEFIILHCADASSVGEQISNFEVSGTSVHYVVDLEGKVYQLVKTENQAFNAGVSSWGTSTQDWRSARNIAVPTLNSLNVSVLFLAPGYARGPLFDEEKPTENRDWYVSGIFSEIQKEVGVSFIYQLMTQFGISRDNVLGFGDVAHYKVGDSFIKTSPMFWDMLAENGIGMPIPSADLEGEPVSIALVQEALRTIGYKRTPSTGELDEETVRVLLSFQQHFMSYKFDDVSYAQQALSNPSIILDPKTFGALEFLTNYVASK